MNLIFYHPGFWVRLGLRFDAGWFNFATGSYECHAMTMLDEIRRERTCELFAENFRMDDLKRWGIAHINLNGRKLGRRILGTAYTNPANTVNGPSNVSNYYGEPISFCHK